MCESLLGSMFLGSIGRRTSIVILRKMYGTPPVYASEQLVTFSTSGCCGRGGRIRKSSSCNLGCPEPAPNPIISGCGCMYSMSSGSSGGRGACAERGSEVSRERGSARADRGSALTLVRGSRGVLVVDVDVVCCGLKTQARDVT